MKLKIALLIILTSVYSYCQSSFLFYGTSVKSGTKQHFKIPVKDGEKATFIPVTVFNGVKDGPVLGITTGIHGYEYPPILAGQKLIKSIDVKSLKGVVILVQMANVASFSNRSPFVNPLDGKNLNRMFPGNIEGTVSQKIAALISKHVIGKSNYFLDIHGGDASEDLTSYSAFYMNKMMPEVSKKGKQMAASLGFDYVVVFNTNGKDYVKKGQPSLYCSAEAFKRGIPSVDIECGKLGVAEEELVFKIEKGVLKMLNNLGMLISKSISEIEKGHLFISKRTYEESNHNGIFYSLKKSGMYVKKGMKLGFITDYFGNTLDTIYAKKSGVILLIIGTPPVNKGDTIAVIGDVEN